MTAEAHSRPVLLEEAAGGFSAVAPGDFRLVYDPARGVYELRSDGRGASVEYMRVTSDSPPADAARAVVEERGLKKASERADADRAVVVAQHPDGRRWTVDVRRDGPGVLAVATYGRRADGVGEWTPGHERTLEWVAASAAGGTPVALAEQFVQQPVEPIALKDYATPDGLAKGKVPDEPGWQTGGLNGALEAAHPARGEMHLGISATICLPGGLTASMAHLANPPWVVAPYLPAEMAVTQIWPHLRGIVEPMVPVADVRIEGAQPQSWGPQFNAAVLAIRFLKGGAPWRGAILASTATLPADDRWLLYFSNIAVPDSDDSSVSQALVKAWEAYDATRANQQKTAATVQASTAVYDALRAANTLQQQTFAKATASWSAQFRA